MAGASSRAIGMKEQAPQLDRARFVATMRRIGGELRKDPHHRQFAWDLQWRAWRRYVVDHAPDEQCAALNLAVYLATWGMYCRGTDLQQRDYRVLMPVARYLRSRAREEWTDCMFRSEPSIAEVVGRLCQVSQGIADVLAPELARPGKSARWVNVSDTLRSKILLGTLCCVPAFDKYVKIGLVDVLGGAYPSGDGFAGRRLAATIALARSSADVIREGQAMLCGICGIEYPLTKVFDLYLWCHGWEA